MRTPRTLLRAVLVLLMGLPWSVLAAEAPKIVVLDFQVSGGLDATLGPALAEASTQSVAKLGFYSPVSSAELRSVINAERQRQLMGCSEETSCLTEIAGAFGAPFLMTGSVARFGEAFQLTIQVINAKNAQPVGRSVRLARDLALLRALVPYAVSEATGAPPPAPPSRVLPYSLMGGGGAAVLAGGLIGLKGLADQAELTSELSQASNLRSLPTYQDRARLISMEKTLSLVLVGAGVAAAAAGFFLNPVDLATSGAVAFTVVPSPSGFAFVGTFR